MGVPLDHDVRVVSQPNRAMLGDRALVVLQQGVVPALVNGASGFAQAVGNPHSLHRVLVLQFPLQIVAGNEVAKPWVEGADVVVLEVDLDEGLPVVVAHMHFDMVKGVTREVELAAWSHASQIGQHIPTIGFKEQTIPFL